MSLLKRKMSKSEELENDFQNEDTNKTVSLSDLKKPLLINEPLFTLTVTGFSSKTSLNDFETLFASYGKIKQTILTRSTVDCKPVCLLELDSQESVDAILRAPPTHDGGQLLVKKYTLSSATVHQPEIVPDNTNSRKKVCRSEGNTSVISSQNNASDTSCQAVVPVPKNQQSQSHESSPAKNKTSPGDLLLRSIVQSNSNSEKNASSSEVKNSSQSSTVSLVFTKFDYKAGPMDHYFDEEISNYVCNLQSCISTLQSMYTECFFAVEKALLRLNMELNCYMFGSSYTGLCRQGSDLDIYVQYAFEDKNQITVLRNCKQALHQSFEFDKIFIIRARTPLVKCYHKKTRIDIDISFKSRLGVYNSVLIKMLLALDSRVKPMIVFLKYWAHNNGLLGSNKMNSYCLSWMIIFLLQRMHILPTSEFLNNFVDTKSSYLGWDVSFFNLSLPRIEVCKELFVRQYGRKEHSIRQLFLEFFHSYLNFDYSNSVICPVNGTIIPRTDIEHLTNLPPCMDRLKQIPNNDRVKMFHSSKIFFLQDPIELSFNVGKCVTTKLKNHFMLCCKNAINALLVDRVNLMMSRLLVPKHFTYRDSPKSKPDKVIPKITKPEEIPSSVADILKSLKPKKASCFTFYIQPNENETYYGNPFDKDKWILDVYYALLYLLNELCKFEISVEDRTTCKDVVLNAKYNEFHEKFDTDRCQIFYCTGYSFVFCNRKKYKSISVPRWVASNLEAEVYKHNFMLKKELAARTSEDVENYKLRFLFLFNPVTDKNAIHFTMLRYFDLNTQPSHQNYSFVFNYLSSMFHINLEMCLNYVKHKKYNISLNASMKALAEKYREKLGLDKFEESEEMQQTPRKKLEPVLKPGVVINNKKNEKPVSSYPDEVIIVDESENEGVTLNVKSEPALYNSNFSDRSRVHDSDVEFVECPPKLIECINVE